jgi:RHS repeat-associated protein
MIKERFGTNTSLYHNSHYNNRQQLVSTRVGDNATDALNWSRGAIDFFYGSTAVASGDKFANDSDNNGNLRRQTNYVPLAGGGYVIPQRDDYTYDALNRISSFTEIQMNSSGQWTPTVARQDFSYDPYGNRKVTGASGEVSDYNPSYDTTNNNNRIMGLGYDPAGNITFDPLTGGTMTYDAENRLRTASNGGGGNYVYNADGKRVRRITSGGEIWHVYGCGGELLAEYAANDAIGAPRKEYGYRNGQLLVIAEPGSGGNLAWGKTTSQSSTGSGGNSSRGVDGNTNGSWNDNSVTHTQLEHQPWWLVDLGSVQQIGTVKLWNRTDCCSERLSNFYVLVSDNPFSSTDLTTTINQAGVSHYHTAGQAGALTEKAVGRSGRYVRVQLAGDNYLSIAEVEVIGSGGGVSFVKPTLKSSTDLIGKAGPEADGNVDKLYVVDEQVADMEFNEDSDSTTADVSSDNKTGTLIDGITGKTVGGYSDTLSFDGVGGELLAEYPLASAPGAPREEYGYRGGRSMVTAQSGGVVTVYPGAYQTPAPGIGGVAVASPNNTEHGSTQVLVSQSGVSGTFNQTKSCLWHSFPGVSGTKTRVTLKFNWTLNASINAEAFDGDSGATASYSFNISSSIDNGSNWTIRVSRNDSVTIPVGVGPDGNSDGIDISGSESFDLPNPGAIDITQIRVRDLISGSVSLNGFSNPPDSSASSELTARVYNIRLEVDTVPDITGVSSSAVTHNSATISWNTNEPADSQVEYGTTNAYGQSTTLDTTPVTAHSQGLSGLTPSTQYHYRVKSRDATGNLAFSVDHTFTTASPPDTTPPVISNVTAGGVTATSATITWTTNENSDSQVEYGTSTAYGQSTTLNPVLVTSHSQGLSGLNPGTQYHYRVKSKDAAGNLAMSGDFSFTTAAGPDTTPPTVTSFSPAAGATNVNANANVTVTFSEAMNAATVNGSTVELRDPSNALVSATVSYNAASLTATLDPTASLAAGVTYTARVRGGGTDPRVKDVAGNALAADVTWTFTTAQNVSSGIKWLVTDHLGSTRMVIDETGSLAGIRRHDFAPFGEEMYAGIRRDGMGQGQYGYEPPQSNVRQRYGSYERDSETGLDFAQARYFSSIQGRFSSPDPVAGSRWNPQSLNAYSYVWNNPLKLTDPTGMIVSWEDSKKEQKKGETEARTNAQRKYENRIKELLNSKDPKERAKGQRLQDTYNRLQSALETFHVVKENPRDASSGELTYAGVPGHLYVNLKGNSSEYGALTDVQKIAHEFKHGEQFLDKLLGFTLGSDGKWHGYRDDLVDEANAFIAGFEAQPLDPAQRGNKFLNAVESARPFGLQAVVNVLDRQGPYVGRSNTQLPINHVSPRIYAVP